MTQLKSHPVANIFPLVIGAKFEALKANIGAEGLHNPIWLHPDGRILDGRNRYRACSELRIEPAYRTYSGPLDWFSLLCFVISQNGAHRELNSGQWAFVALNIEDELATAAKERQGERTDLDPTLLKDFSNVDRNQRTAAAQAAATVRTNPQYVFDAKRIRAEAPDLEELVMRGEMAFTEARRQLQRRHLLTEVPSLPNSTYRVIYADPPWKYGGTHPDYYGPAERHYPAMDIDELCALDIRSLTDEDAVLFLWATSPLLEVAFTVMHAWGFTYKASFIWDKVRHNFGHYNSVRHELLLLCTRGSCLPDEQTLIDSVQTIERTEHSVKPEEFRKIIDTIYPRGRRIELFARSVAPGWERWGNDPG